MVRLLIRTAIFLASAALGLLVAHWVLADFQVHLGGFLLAVVLFAVIQSVITPFIMKMSTRYAPAFVGGAGLVATLLALFAATLLPGGIEIRGVATWLIATLIVWLVTATATVVLPMIFLKKKVAGSSNSTS